MTRVYRRRARWSLLAWLPLLHLSLVLAVLLMTMQRDRTRDPLCFHEIGQCVSGRFRAYWEANGGVAVFGLPITPARPEFNPDANTRLLTQWFERMRFELHPELSPPFDVLLGRLGDDRLW
ncbi:MAG TPA: hypothetical protein VEZ12_05525, partial [Herpetosiphonaceae bacterium]|nr:hypothetical protein [Herpetosiphonaceae bacterium]